MARDDSSETELSRALLQLRRAVVPEPRQVDVVNRTGIGQPRLSRIELGKALPTDLEVQTLARLYGADEQRVAELVQLARDLRAGIRDSRLVVQRGNTLALQQRWGRIERNAELVRSYHPVVVLGMLQTPAYAAVALRQPVDSPEVAERVQRNQRLLREPHRRYLLVQTEGALRQVVGSSQVMAEQVDAIAEAAQLPNVELGVIPAARPVSPLVGSGFNIYDDAATVVGLEVAAARMKDADDVRAFRDLWQRLSALAVYGDDARALLTRISGDHRSGEPA